MLCGKETIDYNGSQVGGMIAELLDFPFVSIASKLDIAGTTATIERDVPGGDEVVTCELPMVVSCAKGMAEQRIPNMRGIMAARTKPLTVVEASEAENHTHIAKYELPEAKGACKYIDPENMAELVELLHSQSKVI